MKLIVFNGSPRGKNSNSNLIISWFVEQCSNLEWDMYNIKEVNRHKEFIEKVEDYDKVLINFPLYTDGMPGIVKAFIEAMEEYQTIFKGKEIAYIIHSGFNEGIHSRGIERYVNWLTNILQAKYAGTIVIPGSEGFRVMHDKMTKKKRMLVNELGKQFVSGEAFGELYIKKIAKTETFSQGKRIMYTILSKIGIMNMYWDYQLKKITHMNNDLLDPIVNNDNYLIYIVNLK